MSVSATVLYVSYDGMTDPLGESQVIPYVLGLSRRGYAFHLLSFEKPARFRSEGARVAALLEGGGVTWHPMRFTARPRLVAKALDAWRLRRAVVRLHDAHGFDLVHARSYPAAGAALALRRRRRVPYLFDMRGFWVDERVEGGIWDARRLHYRWLYRHFKRREQAYLAGAAAVVSLTEAAVTVLRTWPGVRDGLPIEVIPCCVDTELFAPATGGAAGAAGGRGDEGDAGDSGAGDSGEGDSGDSGDSGEGDSGDSGEGDSGDSGDSDSGDSGDPGARARRDLDIPAGATVLAYLGSIGTWYLLDDMLRFFRALLDVRPDARFLFVTRHDPADLRQAARRHDVPPERVVVRSAVRSEVPRLLRAADLSVFFIRPTFSKTASCPTKLGELMALGVPVVCNAGVGDVDAIVRDNRAGRVLDDLGDGALREAAAAAPALIALPREPIVEAADRLFSLDRGVERYAALYERILAGDGPP